MRQATEFQNIRRSALVLKPKQPFYDWVKSIRDIPEEMQTDKADIEPPGEPDVYLLPDYETTEQMERWVSRNFDWLFCEQLNSWYSDEYVWIQNRTFKMFKEWFDYSLHTMVWDSQDGPIDKMM